MEYQPEIPGRKGCKTAGAVRRNMADAYQGIRIETGMKSSGKHSRFCILLADFSGYPGKTRKMIAIRVRDLFIFGSQNLSLKTGFPGTSLNSKYGRHDLPDVF